MDEYADFVEASLRETNPTRAARQKELEERIRTPFRMVDGKVLEAEPFTRSILKALEKQRAISPRRPGPRLTLTTRNRTKKQERKVIRKLYALHALCV